MTNRIAITAIGVVSPIGCTFDTFTERLLAGESGERRLKDALGPTYADVPVEYGAVVDTNQLSSIADFDSAGPHHRSVRFAADALAQVLRTSGDVNLREASLHCGVGVGMLCPEMSDVREFGAQEMLAEFERQLEPDRVEPTLPLSSATRADGGTRALQRWYGLEGVSGTYSGACSASTQACIAACEDVAFGATFAIGGGHDSLLGVAGIQLMYELGTLTDDSRIRPFDVDRDGTLLGEGAVYFLFEDLEHARARGAHVMAEVTGWSSSLDGYHLTSPDPTGKPAEGMIRKALREAKLDPKQIGYVNAHGTSTVLNDVMESQVIERALSGHRAYVSSTKAQVGHLIAACGAIGLAACVAGLERQMVPPNPHLVNPDPECEVRLAPQKGIAASLENVLCNSFGFGGQNSCIVLNRGVAGAQA